MINGMVALHDPAQIIGDTTTMQYRILNGIQDPLKTAYPTGIWKGTS
jgi:hypothetical protein